MSTNAAVVLLVGALIVWLLVGVAPIALMIVNPESVAHLAANSRFATAGVIGDSFGLVNSLFSGLGFAFAIYAILLQTRQNNITRDDGLRELARHELAELRYHSAMAWDALTDYARAINSGCQEREETMHFRSVYKEAIHRFGAHSVTLPMLFGKSGVDIAIDVSKQAEEMSGYESKAERQQLGAEVIKNLDTTAEARVKVIDVHILNAWQTGIQ